MAFRSEVDALRSRAEEAEAKLAVEAKKNARVDHADARLEEAKRLARASAIGQELQWRRAFVIGIVGGFLLGALGTFAFGPRPPIPPARVIVDADRAEHAEAERDDAVEATLRMRGSYEVLLLGATGEAAFPRPFGRVIGTHGEAPTLVGASCRLERAAIGSCVATLLCDDSPVHSFGCLDAPRTRDEIRGDDAWIANAESAWSVTIAVHPAPGAGTATAALEGLRGGTR